MIKYELNFHRYFSDGSLHFTYQIPDKFIQKYQGSGLNTTARIRVWADASTKAFISFNGTKHIITDFLRDEYIYEDIKSFLVGNDAIKFRKSWSRYASNFFVAFVNTEDAKKVKGEPTEKKERQPRKEKVVDEKKQSFRQLKAKTKKKIQFIQKMQNWKDPNPMADTDEHYLKVAVDIFNSYKLFFEENLTARNIKFYVSSHGESLPDIYRGAKLFTDYVLVDNTENASPMAMQKQNWEHITLAWFPTRIKIEEWSHRTVLLIKKIGMARSGGLSVRRGYLRALQPMQESSFTEIVDSSYRGNNEKYASKIEHFKSLKTKMAENKAEEDKLKKHINDNIIPIVNVKNLRGTALDFEKEKFSITETNCWRMQRALLDISTSTDNMEELTIKIGFFGSWSTCVHTADEAIAVMHSIFGKNFHAVLDSFIKASQLN